MTKEYHPFFLLYLSFRHSLSFSQLSKSSNLPFLITLLFSSFPSQRNTVLFQLSKRIRCAFLRSRTPDFETTFLCPLHYFFISCLYHDCLLCFSFHHLPSVHPSICISSQNCVLGTSEYCNNKMNSNPVHFFSPSNVDWKRLNTVFRLNRCIVFFYFEFKQFKTTWKFIIPLIHLMTITNMLLIEL